MPSSPQPAPKLVCAAWATAYSHLRRSEGIGQKKGVATFSQNKHSLAPKALRPADCSVQSVAGNGLRHSEVDLLATLMMEAIEKSRIVRVKEP